MREVLLEVKRSDLLSRSKSSDNYVPSNQHKGKNRYYRRTHSKLASSVKNFNSIDMNKFFKTDILDVDIDVTGETDLYTVRISFAGTVDQMYREISKGRALDRRLITQCLLRAFNADDVYINCTCPDFCLHKDTKIKLLSGETLSVEEMCNKFEDGEELWVYSTDEEGNFVPGRVLDVWETKQTKEFVKVTLDNDEFILTTPEHLYRLRDGSYIEASNLKIGTPLMPLYFSYHDGYECVKTNNPAYPSQFCSVYKQVANNLLLDEIEEARVRSGEENIAIHHSDFNKSNNVPDNLKPMGVLEHWNYHSQHIQESGVLDKWIQAGQAHNDKVKDHTTEEYKKQAEVCRSAITNYYANRTEEEIQRDSESRSKVTKDAWERGCFDTEAWKNATKKRGEFLHTPEIKELTRQGVIRYYANRSDEEKQAHSERSSKITKSSWERGCFDTEARRNARKNAFHYERTHDTERRRNITKIGNVINKIIEADELPTSENYEKFRTNGYPKFTKIFDSWEEVVEYFNLNHKVKNIEFIYLDEFQPVYDIQVDKYENFLVDAGVILHNCFRGKYWATRNEILIGAPEDRPSDITNPNDTKGPGCKHITLALSDSSWLIRVSSVIYNYINYLKELDSRLYQEYIYPAIYKEPYPNDETQLDISNIDDSQLGNLDIRFSEYQELVDSDMEKFGDITDDTLDLIADAGLYIDYDGDIPIVVGNKLDVSNRAAVERGRFKKNPKSDSDEEEEEVKVKSNKNQISLDDFDEN